MKIIMALVSFAISLNVLAGPTENVTRNWIQEKLNKYSSFAIDGNSYHSAPDYRLESCRLVIEEKQVYDNCIYNTLTYYVPLKHFKSVEMYTYGIDEGAFLRFKTDGNYIRIYETQTRSCENVYIDPFWTIKDLILTAFKKPAEISEDDIDSRLNKAFTHLKYLIRKSGKCGTDEPF